MDVHPQHSFTVHRLMADAVRQVQSHTCTDTSTSSDTLVVRVLMELNAPHFTSKGTLKMWLRSSLRAVLKKMRSCCQESQATEGHGVRNWKGTRKHGDHTDSVRSCRASCVALLSNPSSFPCSRSSCCVFSLCDRK